jgi:hypothetical protein
MPTTLGGGASGSRRLRRISAGGRRRCTITPPPGTSPQPPEPEGCTDGHEKDGELIETRDFRLLGGRVTVDVPTAAWKRAANVMSAEQFADLGTSTIEELSEGIEQESTRSACECSFRP